MADTQNDDVPPSVPSDSRDGPRRDSQLFPSSSDRSESGSPHRSRSQSAWSKIDEASIQLHRASSLVTLLSSDTEASEHQVFSADVAVDLLHEVAGLLSASQQILRPRKSDQSVDIKSELVELGELARLLDDCAGRVEMLAGKEGESHSRSVAVVASAGCLEVAKKALEQARTCLKIDA